MVAKTGLETELKYIAIKKKVKFYTCNSVKTELAQTQ